MTILLDIDGVLVTTPAWRPVEILADGFMKFNERAASNLQRIITQTDAAIILTTTHRINYSLDTWKEIFQQCGILSKSISKLNDKSSIQEMLNRAEEIKKWFDRNGDKHNFVIIDDDLSINALPTEIKNRSVLTKPLIGLAETATEEALRILQMN